MLRHVDLVIIISSEVLRVVHLTNQNEKTLNVLNANVVLLNVDTLVEFET